MFNSLMRTVLAVSFVVVPLATAGPAAGAEVPLREAVGQLKVADEHRTGYKRDAFRHWVDADRDGCSTRSEVLLEEAVQAPTRSGRCTLSGGTWHSLYDDTTIAGPRGLDIDHMVPLAEAWDSGASAWDAQRRQDYANDLGAKPSLIAVSARTNRSKADQDPAEWMPPAATARCTYIGDWVATKLRWGLTVDRTEQRDLATRASQCPNVSLDVEAAARP